MDNTTDNTIALLRATLVTRFKANCALDQVSSALGIGVETLRENLDDYLSKWSRAEEIGAVQAMGDGEIQRLLTHLETADRAREAMLRELLDDGDLLDESNLLSEDEDAMEGRR